MKSAALTYYSTRPFAFVKQAVWHFLLLDILGKRSPSSCGPMIGWSDRTSTLDPVAVTQCIDEALQLIASRDAYRFRVVLQQVRTVFHAIDIFPARYIPLRKACKVDMEQAWNVCSEFNIPKPQYCACMIIHEAFHGYLLSKGVRHTPSQLPRIERICNKQAYLFARRSLGLKDGWVKIYGPGLEVHGRISSREKWKRALERIRELKSKW